MLILKTNGDEIKKVVSLLCLCVGLSSVFAYELPRFIGNPKAQKFWDAYFSSTLVIEMPKLRFKSGENIDCSFYLHCKDPAKRYNGHEKFDMEEYSDRRDHLPYENPNFYRDPDQAYFRVFFELYRVEGKQSIAIPHKIGEKVPDEIACPKRNKNYDQTCDITKLFDIKPGKYKIRLVMQKVDQLEITKYEIPSFERDEQDKTEEPKMAEPEPEPEPEEAKKNREIYRKIMEQRKAEALNKPRKIETIKTSDWVEFEVVE